MRVLPLALLLCSLTAPAAAQWAGPTGGSIDHSLRKGIETANVVWQTPLEQKRRVRIHTNTKLPSGFEGVKNFATKRLRQEHPPDL